MQERFRGFRAPSRRETLIGILLVQMAIVGNAALPRGEATGVSPETEVQTVLTVAPTQTNTPIPATPTSVAKATEDSNESTLAELRHEATVASNMQGASTPTQIPRTSTPEPTATPVATATPEPPTSTPEPIATVVVQEPTPTVPLPPPTPTPEPPPPTEVPQDTSPGGYAYGAGPAAYYDPSIDWYRIYYLQASWGNEAARSGGPSPYDYHCAHADIDLVGVPITLSANGVTITCITADTVQDAHKWQWRQSWAIELSWTAFVALGLDTNNYVEVYIP